MTCYDCAVAGQSTPAVAVCLGCGVGLCMAHAIVESRHLTRTAVINRVELVEPPARRRCTARSAPAQRKRKPDRPHATQVVDDE